MKQLNFNMFNGIMLFYIFSSTELNIYTICTMVDHKRFSVLRVDHTNSVILYHRLGSR